MPYEAPEFASSYRQSVLWFPAAVLCDQAGELISSLSNSVAPLVINSATMICCCESPWKDEMALDLAPQRVLENSAEQVLPDKGRTNAVVPVKGSGLSGVSGGLSAVSVGLTADWKSKTTFNSVSFGVDKEQCYLFTVGLHRAPDTSFGLDLSAAGRICLVNAVGENSLIADWNRMWLEKGAKEQTVQQFDRLVALNTERPSKGRDMMQKLRESTGQVNIVIQRPIVRKIKINKKLGEELGITIIDGFTFMMVASIAEGVFRDHNEKAAHAEEIIHLPTIMVAVDGMRGNGSELLKFMRDAEGPFEVEVLYYD